MLIDNELAIQDEKDYLLNVLDVFVKEPLTEWRDRAAKMAKQKGPPLNMFEAYSYNWIRHE